MVRSRFLQLMTFEYLPNDGFSGVVRVTQVQPIRDSNLPPPVLNLLHELSVLSRNSECRDGSRSLAFRGVQWFGCARSSRERGPVGCTLVRWPTGRV